MLTTQTRSERWRVPYLPAAPYRLLISSYAFSMQNRRARFCWALRAVFWHGEAANSTATITLRSVSEAIRHRPDPKGARSRYRGRVGGHRLDANHHPVLPSSPGPKEVESPAKNEDRCRWTGYRHFPRQYRRLAWRTPSQAYISGATLMVSCRFALLGGPQVAGTLPKPWHHLRGPCAGCLSNGACLGLLNNRVQNLSKVRPASTGRVPGTSAPRRPGVSGSRPSAWA